MASVKRGSPRQARKSCTFPYDPTDTVDDVVKGNLAVPYLLESITDSGTSPLDGMIPNGLAETLRHYATVAYHYLTPKAHS